MKTYCKGFLTFSGRFRMYWIPLLIEGAFTIAAARLSVLLLGDQLYFDHHRPLYNWLEGRLLSSEFNWGVFCALSALSMGCGVIAMAFRGRPDVIEAAFYLRQLGWGGSVLVWTAFSVSITIAGSFDTIFSIASIACAMLSVGGLLMGPIMPPEDGGPQ